MASRTQAKLEGLVDLFLSPHFHPVKHEAQLQPAAPGRMQFEAEMMEDEDKEKDITTDETLIEFGHQLAAMGDEYFTSHASAAMQTQPKISLSVIDDKLKSIFINLANIEERAAGDLLEEQEKAWSTYKGVIRTSISDVCGSDVKLMLGAFLLCLNGLSHLEAPARRWAREFSLRFVQSEVIEQNARRLDNILNNDDDALD